MTKNEKALHEQKLINALNSRLDDIENKLTSDPGPTAEKFLKRSRENTLRRLSQLYGTEKYGLV